MPRKYVSMSLFTRYLIPIGVLCILLVGCVGTPFYKYHGYIPKQKELDALVINVDSKVSVEDAIGVPQSTALIHDNVWYYVASRWETKGYSKPRPIVRRIAALSFDDNDVLQNIETFRLADGRVIPLTQRVTATSVQETNLFREMAKSFGNINAGQFR